MPNDKILYVVHFTKKPRYRKEMRRTVETSEEYSVYLTPEEHRDLGSRLRQLDDAGLIVALSVDPLEPEITSPEQVDIILSRLCFGLPVTASIEEIRKAQTAAESAAVGHATAAGAEGLKRKLELATEKLRELESKRTGKPAKDEDF